MVEGFIDLHCHILPGMDDGAQDIQTSRQMLTIAYEDGIHHIVLTPHMRRPWLDITEEQVQMAYQELQQAAREISKDLQLYLGSEVYYSHELLENYAYKLRPMNGTPYMLVEFSPQTSYNELLNGIGEIQNLGHEVILAHIERYQCLTEDINRVEHLYDAGVYLQMNARTITKPMDRRQKKFAKEVLHSRFIHVIASDAHGIEHRRPAMQECYRLVARKISEDYAQEICISNGLKMLQGQLL